MRLPRLSHAAILGLALGAAACSGSTTSPTTTSTTTSTATLVNEVVTGTVPVPVNGVLQASSSPFTIAASGGAIAVTLTSAVETMPDGTLLPTVTMGLGIGAWSNGTCTLLSGGFTTAQASATAQLSGTINSGAYCVQVSDVTNQVGPVAYAVALSHY
ncbi:MAG: hypothetical protein QM736_26310 [Vicinamibacterales bacterium]